MATRAPPRPSVIFVREAEHQTSSSGCCGRLEGDFLAGGGEPVFAERRKVIESMGPLYQALRARFGTSIDLEVVDPRSLPALAGLLLRDILRHRVPIPEVLRTVVRLPVRGVLVNGRLVARGAWPSPERVFEALRATGAGAHDATGEIGRKA